eukprot:CAMPEP_0172879430 /NCGR_PEP_ID=MMETSP1075-20121228/112464_1 /TAXON_ID=2916 /ORGANISM="Ceratium fusus, Strain PA161109" /LENGTH=42 /DNA_ID= /DNA_START= /DNA_END= /DNA_ORIENTATION=
MARASGPGTKALFPVRTSSSNVSCTISCLEWDGDFEFAQPML